jgi:hypothetical protein
MLPQAAIYGIKKIGRHWACKYSITEIEFKQLQLEQT